MKLGKKYETLLLIIKPNNMNSFQKYMAIWKPVRGCYRDIIGVVKYNPVFFIRVILRGWKAVCHCYLHSDGLTLSTLNTKYEQHVKADQFVAGSEMQKLDGRCLRYCNV